MTDDGRKQFSVTASQGNTNVSVSADSVTLATDAGVFVVFVNHADQLVVTSASPDEAVHPQVQEGSSVALTIKQFYETGEP